MTSLGSRNRSSSRFANRPPMTPSDILKQLTHLPIQAEFEPYEAALKAAADQREAIIPNLIAALERVCENPAPHLENDEDALFLFALPLLAEWRVTRALDVFLRFFSLPEDTISDLADELVTANGAAYFASVCGGNPAPLLKLIHDENVSEFVREQAICGLAVQCVWGERPREAVIEELRGLFSTLPKPGNPFLWAGLVLLILDFKALELLPEARHAFAEGLVDDSIVDIQGYETEASQHGDDSTLEEFCDRYSPINAIEECSEWQCFNEEPEEDPEIPYPDDDDDSDETLFEDDPEMGRSIFEEGSTPTPYIAPLKVGRNDPCPCGSGRKHKKCCGN